MLTKEWVAQNTKKFFWHNTMPVRASVFWWGPNLHTMETMNLFSVLAVLSQQTSFELTCNGLSWASGNWHHFCGIVCAHCVWKTETFSILTSAENLGCAWSVLFGKSVGTSGSSALAKFFWIGWIKGSTASVVAMVPTVEKHGETNLTNEEVLNSGVHDFARTSNRLSVIDKRRIPWIIAWSVTQRMPSFCLNFCHKNSSFGNMCSMTEHVQQCVTQLSCGAHFAKSAVLAAKQHSEVWMCVSSLSAIFFEHCWVCVRIFWCVHFKIWIL